MSLSSPPSPDTLAAEVFRVHSEVLEPLRQEKLHLWKQRIVIACGLFVVVLAGWWIFPSLGFPYIVFLMFTPFALIVWVASVPQDYARQFKDRVLSQIAESFGLTYVQDGGIPLDRVKRAATIPDYNRRKMEDYFTGVYKGAHIHLSELTLFQRSQHSGRNQQGRKQIRVFAGLAILLELPRVRFSGQTVIMPRGLMSPRQEKVKALESVDLVDPAFRRKYRVYGSDQVEARFLLHPAMVERIERLEHGLVQIGVSVAFLDGCVLVLVPTMKNMFEPPGMFVPVDKMDGILMLEHELREVLALVDAFEFYRPQQA